MKGYAIRVGRRYAADPFYADLTDRPERLWETRQSAERALRLVARHYPGRRVTIVRGRP